jgi:DNA invertase Pin-like site-specific DNA recombinase
MLPIIPEDEAMKKVKRAVLYCRVSTQEQSTAAQESELKEFAKNRGWDVARVYSDTISGTKDSRPGLNQLMADCHSRKIDVVLVWKFDRFARSVSHLLRALETFEELGVEFVSISEQVDTSTAAGKMIFTVLGAVAALERSLIAERTKLGILNARKQGKRIGRPPIRTLTAAEVMKVRADRASGKFSLRQLAAKYRASLWAMQQATLGHKSRP